MGWFTLKCTFLSVSVPACAHGGGGGGGVQGEGLLSLQIKAWVLCSGPRSRSMSRKCSLSLGRCGKDKLPTLQLKISFERGGNCTIFHAYEGCQKSFHQPFTTAHITSKLSVRVQTHIAILAKMLLNSHIAHPY